MGHWTHRVIRKVYNGEDYFSIHEVFYDLSEKDTVGWTENPVEVAGESIEDLRVTLQRMLACLDKPVIEDND
jgi:hypothetical protein